MTLETARLALTLGERIVYGGMALCIALLLVLIAATLAGESLAYRVGRADQRRADRAAHRRRARARREFDAHADQALAAVVDIRRAREGRAS